MERIVFSFFVLYSVLNFGGFVFGNNNIILRVKNSSVSQQNLLRNARFFWENGHLRLKPIFKKSLAPDTLKVLGLRVEFQVDEDDKTTGNGRFDLSVSSKTAIDPSPHDQTYFKNQLTALANYYYSVSNNKLVLISEVVDTIFVLPHEMGYYNPDTDDEKVDRGLAELFHDAIMLADSSGVDFTKYDCFIIFHAGVGRDINLGYDPTPSDIPSAFLSLEDLRKQLAENDPLYQGIEVDNGKGYIKEGIILPETECQEGYEIGLLGTMTLMFGFQLGLPALWNTENGRSGIGQWGLMDQGSGNYNGLIPAEPSAWSKVFLGWETPIDTLQGNGLKVACSKTKEPYRIYRIPINDHEYFLIENRIHDPDGDGVTLGWDSSGNEITFQPDGTLSPKPEGVIIKVKEYDYGLPGSGILIWHVDDQVISGGISQNKVNINKNHRGVDLEEADGAQDIGEAYSFTEAGAGSETGVMYDAWFKDNKINKLVNNSDKVEFTPYTHPDSRSYSGANSHIVISDFSEIDTVMSFTVKNDLIHQGFPEEFGKGATFPPLFGNLNNNGETDIFVATRNGKIYAWDQNGNKVIPNDFIGQKVSLSGDTVNFPLALFADAGEDITVSPLVGDINDDGVDEIVAVTNEGHILGWVGKDENGDGLADEILDWGENSDRPSVLIFASPEKRIIMGTQTGKVLTLYRSNLIWERALSSASVTGISQYGSEGKLAVTTANGEIFLLGSTGDILWQKTFTQGEKLTSSTAWFLPNQLSIVTLSSQGLGLVIDEAGNEKARFGENVLPELPSSPAVGDLDGDGFMEIVTTANGQIWCFNHNGSLVDNFPAPRFERDVNLSSPILGDVDGDGKIDVIVTCSNGNIEAYNNNGNMVDGFPLTTGGSQIVSPLLLDLDNDGKMELSAVSQQGFIFVWDLPGKYSDGSVVWGSFAHDPGHSGMNPRHLNPLAPKNDPMPTDLVYNYPNPTRGNFTTIRYRLEKQANVLVKIFDPSGEIVDSFPGPGMPQTENEAIWNLRNVESGVYFCQVKATGNGWEKTVTFKIAVVK